MHINKFHISWGIANAGKYSGGDLAQIGPIFDDFSTFFTYKHMTFWLINVNKGACD